MWSGLQDTQFSVASAFKMESKITEFEGEETFQLEGSTVKYSTEITPVNINVGTALALTPEASMATAQYGRFSGFPWKGSEDWCLSNNQS